MEAIRFECSLNVNLLMKLNTSGLLAEQFIYFDFSKDSLAEMALPTIKPSVSYITPNKREISNNGWKTYRNQEKGFEVKYPSNFSLHEDEYQNRYSITFGGDKKHFFQIKAVKDEEHTLYREGTIKYHLDSEPFDYGKIDHLNSTIFYLSNGYCDGPNCSSPTKRPLPIKAHKVKKDNIVYTLTIVGTKEFITESEDMFVLSFKLI